MSYKAVFLASAAVFAILPQVAMAQGTPPAQPAPATAAAPAPEGDDVIIVTGLRRSLQSAQAIKRNSDQIVDSVVAEDIGKLPDINVSDSLARITGVQVNRANGEAGAVLIRGLDQFVTTYNGRDIFTAEARRVATQDFPAGGVAALEVFKSSSANLIEPGLAGLINVRSRRPFDFKGLEIAGAVNAIYTDQRKAYDWNGNLLVSDRWESGIGEFGALVNVSYTTLRYLDSARFDGGFIERGTLDSPGVFRRANSDAERASPNAIRYPDGVGIFYGQGDRQRPSVNAALQWKPTPDLEFYFDGLYQGFRRQVSDHLLFVPLFGDGRFTNVVLRPGGTAVQSLTSTNSVRPELFQAATNERTDTYQFAVGGVWTGERLKLSADVAHTDTNFNLSIYSLDTAFARSPVVNVNFDVPRGDGGVEFNFVDFDTRNPANFVYRGFFDRQLVARGDDIQARVDLEYDTQLSFLPKLYVGGRFVDKNGSFQNGERYSPQEGLRLGLSSLPLDIGILPGGFRGSDIQPTRQWAGPLRESIRDNVGRLRTLAGFAAGEPPGNPLQAFTANEKSYAAYGQLRYEFGVGVPIDGLVGIRVVRTEEVLNGTSRVTTGGVEQFVPAVGRNNYTDYLPNASLRARFTDALQLRLAFSQTRTRPEFGQLNPSLVIDPPGGNSFRTARGGNAGLKPVKSDNYDATLEYYFSPTGSASVGVFRRNIDGFISGFSTFITDPVYGQLRVDRPENSGQGKLEGVEAAFTTFFDFGFLPEWAKGFGVQANFTYTSGDRGVPPTLGTGITQRFGFEGVSKYTYNLIGLYEKNGVSARLAYNHRSDFPNSFELNGSGGSFAGEFTSGISRLDFSLSYTPVPNLTLAVDASNLLGQPFRNFRNYDTTGRFPRDVRYEERVYSVGVRFRL